MGIRGLVSVIITTYKREPEMVCRAVKSVLNQTYNNMEIIVVDDSPKTFINRESVKAEVLALNKNIKYIMHEQNEGACAARNTGIKLAKGEFVAFLDDDDEWVNTKLEKQISCFNDKNIGLVYCKYIKINEVNNKQVSEIMHYEMYRGNIYEKLILYNFVGSTSFVLMRKSVLLQSGIFDNDMKSAQDYDLWLRASKICQVEYIDEPLVKYYIHGDQCITANADSKISGFERLNTKNWEYIKTNKVAYWYRVRILILYYVKKRQLIIALNYWFKSSLKRPFKFLENSKMFLRVVKYYFIRK